MSWIGNGVRGDRRLSYTLIPDATPPMRTILPLLLPLLLTLAGTIPLAAESRPLVPDPELFPVPESLEPAVGFWSDVYSRWDSHHVLIHDDRHLGIVYGVLDFSELEESGVSEVRKRRTRRVEIDRAKERAARLLSDLAAGRSREGAEDELRRLEILFRDVPGGASKYTEARSRIRSQTCLRDRFARAVEISGLYLPEMERMFAAAGLPVELTRMPFVESMFQSHARSKVAAAGLWQFMPGTGKLYLRMDLEVDERFDPLRATSGAGRLLADNYEALGTWPLAITAYNHGRYGMQRAVRRHGTTEIDVLVEKYRSRTFGFASRNFYAEFIAAARVYADREEHFPDATPQPPLRFAELVPDRFVHVPALAAAAGAEVATLKGLNPGLEDLVWSGDLLFPADYALRVPDTSLPTFEAAYRGLPAGRTSSHQTVRYYTVRTGDSLGSIATRFGTSVGRLQSANRISNPHRIRVGQKIMIPPGRGEGSAPEKVAAVPASHSVRPGESLTSIATRYGLSVAEIQSANSLSRPDLLVPGQELRLPSATTSARTHVVRPGESLTGIAARYGTSVARLKVENGLSSTVIHPRQVLRIP